MQKTVETIRSLRRLRHALLLLVVAGLQSPLLRSQEIRIKVLDGRNGRPISSECVNVSLGSAPDSSFLIPTDKDGIALIRLAGKDTGENVRRHSSKCNGAAVLEPIAKYSDTIKVTGDYYIPCQPHPPDSPFLSFSTKKVLLSGDVTENHCGRIEASPKPGELIFFVRPLHWWEGMKK